MNDAGGAQHREAADDTEARVPGLERQFGAVLDGNLDLDVGCDADARAKFAVTTSVIILAWDRVDCRFADQDRQPGLGHGADAIARLEARCRHPRTEAAHARHHQRAVGDVGVVARILDDGLPWPSRRLSFRGPAESMAVRPWAG
jgi:hypothetical protein